MPCITRGITAPDPVAVISHGGLVRLAAGSFSNEKELLSHPFVGLIHTFPEVYTSRNGRPGL